MTKNKCRFSIDDISFHVKYRAIVTVFCNKNVIVLILTTNMECNEFIYYDIYFLLQIPQLLSFFHVLLVAPPLHEPFE